MSILTAHEAMGPSLRGLLLLLASSRQVLPSKCEKPRRIAQSITSLAIFAKLAKNVGPKHKLS